MITTAYELDGAELRRALRGAKEFEEGVDGIRPRRLDAVARRRIADHGIVRAADETAGVSLRLLTAAQRIDIEATVSRGADGDRPPRFAATFVAEVDGVMRDRVDLVDGPVRRIRPDGGMVETPGARTRFQLDLGGDGARERPVVVRLPHAAATVLHRIRTSAPARSAPASAAPVWLHHGSSISHGHEADGPRSPWAHRAARSLELELLDFAFAGNAMLDPFVADAIAGEKVELISVKIGINLVGGDAMRLRTFIPALHGFLDRVRAGHPSTPILLMTAIACPIHENVPGPTRALAGGGHEGTRDHGDPSALTLGMTRSAVESVAASRSDDPDLHLLDGRLLLGAEDVDRLADGVHPDDAGHALMAERFVGLAADIDGPVARAISAARSLTSAQLHG